MELFLFISRAVTARSFCSPGGRGGASYRPRSSTEAWEKPHSWRPAPLLRSYPSRKTPAMGKDWIQPELFPCWCPAFRVHPKPVGFAEGIMESLCLENPSETESSCQPSTAKPALNHVPKGRVCTAAPQKDNGSSGCWIAIVPLGSIPGAHQPCLARRESLTEGNEEHLRAQLSIPSQTLELPATSSFL